MHQINRRGQIKMTAPIQMRRIHAVANPLQWVVMVMPQRKN